MATSNSDVSSSVKVWVNVVDGKRRECTSVLVACNADIDDVVKVVISQEKLDITPTLVEVKYKQKVLQRDQLISKAAEKTSAELPLVLHCRVEGMQSTEAISVIRCYCAWGIGGWGC